MRPPSVYDPNYDPQNFPQDFPQDEQLQLALKAALELSKTIQRELQGNTPDEAQTHIEEKFKELRLAVDNELDRVSATERRATRDKFIEDKTAEIIAKHQPGINATSNYELKVGGQVARDEEVQRLQQNYNDHPEFKQVMNDLAHFQAARSVAISHAIEYTPPAGRQLQHERPEGPTPTNPTPPDDGGQKQKQTALEQKQSDIGSPTPNAPSDAAQKHEYFEPLPWESQLEANERGTRAMEAMQERLQQERTRTITRDYLR